MDINQVKEITGLDVCGSFSAICAYGNRIEFHLGYSTLTTYYLRVWLVRWILADDVRLDVASHDWRRQLETIQPYEKVT
jgi:hypothetical protein